MGPPLQGLRWQARLGIRIATVLAYVMFVLAGVGVIGFFWGLKNLEVGKMVIFTLVACTNISMAIGLLASTWRIYNEELGY